MLFNGGVFKADALQDRLLDVLGAWFGEAAPQLLAGAHDLDHAVARGAAYYGWAKQHGGVRIRGGTARAYYVGIETAGLAVPGAPRPLRALCVVPIGMEEGTEADVPCDEIGLVVGEPAQFRFFSSSVAQAGPARRPARPLGRRGTVGDRLAGGRTPGRRSRSTTTTCPSASRPGSPNSACSNSGASAPSPPAAGSWSSASAKTQDSSWATSPTNIG